MAKPHVLIIPYPAQGHVIPIIELGQRLVNHGVKVTVVNTEVTQVTSNALKKNGFGDLLQSVSIPDGLEQWEDRSDLCKLTNSVTMLASMLSSQKLIDAGIINNNGIPLNQEMIQLSETMPAIKPTNLWWTRFDDLPTAEAFFEVVQEAAEAARLTEWHLCRTTMDLEPGALSLYPQLLPVGPLLASNRLADQTGHFWQEDSTCLAWLDQQPPCSVIYVAFGSFTLFNQTQFEELAIGLELSNRPFLWVVRPGMTKETTSAYPQGYVERMGSRGRIVSWAPQQKVLAHPSVACFVNHCGWNSTLEGVTNGLPFLCWPYFADQFNNENYICDIWNTGLGFRKDEAGIVTRGEIKSKVEQLLRENTFRAKAMDIKEKVTSSIRVGGSAHKNLCNFIKWIQELQSPRIDT